LNVAIVGCGLIGQKRARVLGKHRLAVAVDVTESMAACVAGICSCSETCTNWEDAVTRTDVDLVIVATTNDFLAPVSLAAIKNGKHVLVEKPAARNYDELLPLLQACEQGGVKVRVGFNLRYHPAFRKARDIIDSGALGSLMFVRGRYGHGGRTGYDREWRAVPGKAGGGELLDQGIHLVDLSRWFLGDFEHVEGFTHTYFWDMPVEDNGFMCLRTPSRQVAWLHASCTEWKNMFSFEIYGQFGKLHIEGLGGSYGVERLYYYKMLPQMGPPETTIWEYPFPDDSWQLEFDDFISSIENNGGDRGNLKDALATLKIVQQIYGGKQQ
jgi:predicted dehydrogenase